MILGHSGRVHDPKTNYVNFGYTKLLQIIREITKPFCKKKVVEILKYWRSTFRMCWKRRVPKNPEAPPYKFSKVLSMGSISIQNMKWEFGNFPSNEMQTKSMCICN